MKFIFLFLFNFSPNLYGNFFYFPKENVDSILIYLEVPIHMLVFTKYENKYFTEFEIFYTIYDKKGKEIKGERFVERVELDRPVKYISKDSVIIKEFSVVDTVREKKIVLRIRNFEKEWQMERKFERKGELILGDIVFKDDGGNILHRIEDVKRINLYMEIYSIKYIEEKYKIEFWKRNKIEKTFEGFIKGKGHLVLNSALDLFNLVSGDYKVRVYFEKSKRYEERDLPFYGVYLFTNKDFYMIVDALYYFADPQDVDSLRLAPVNKRREYWEKFWKKRDPTPDTPENEFEEEFLRRFYYANENFGVYTPGYRTARGRIYILYGEPDEIERHPFEIDSYPYEIWYYYNKKLKFVFVDRKGIGEYELVPSDSPYYISPWK